ncbi:SAM-dependent methyltransferase [Pararhizobium capsulatum DSM 1112]|uniref:SAM-dependent methyltransferase n=1 Tax=Pararhizobium capsulatum DSM 1112 TaxID=1121113 RepID=A0ABU0BZ13_9HYPH|nr:class I SAM-dependent methyltransferase [Pararhizobium capsulatum]MDQ0323505.1 SAM-dependent methyltransferase [Pararhizobium capsulatum DSM 1112]
MPSSIRLFLRSNPAVYKTYGIAKYALFRAKLLLSDWRDKRAAVALGALPIPPPMLRFRVSGSFDVDQFLEVGRRGARELEVLARLGGKDLACCPAVLDFACGCGRVIRHFQDHAPEARWYGSDIDGEAIRWCKEKLGAVAGFTENDFRPPMSFDPDSFDVVYSVSLFTHLDEDDQFRWLGELARVLRKNGLLIATAHGPYTHQQLPPADLRELTAKGFLYRVGQTGRLKLDGLPDFYQTAYHTEKYIRARWSEHFEIVAYKERAMNEHQDAVVLRKKTFLLADC